MRMRIWSNNKGLRLWLIWGDCGHDRSILNSVVGSTNPKMMKIKRFIGKHSVVTLIDLEATQFYFCRLGEKLGFAGVQDNDIGCNNGNKRSCFWRSVCQGVALHFQGVDIVDDYLCLFGQLICYIGSQMAWELGTTHMNWKQQVMKFRIGEDTVTRGDPSLGKTGVLKSHDENHKAWRERDICWSE